MKPTILVPALILGATLACGGSNSGSSEQRPRSFSVIAPTGPLSVTNDVGTGNHRTSFWDLQVRRVNYAGPVHFTVEGEPARSQVDFSDADPREGTARLQVGWSGWLDAGTYTLQVKATVDGIGTQVLPLTLLVPDPPAVTMSLRPEVDTLSLSQGTTSSVRVYLHGQYPSTADLSVTGLGASAAFSTPTATFPGTDPDTATKLDLDTTHLAPGTYPLLLHAKVPGLPEVTAPFTLSVTE